MVACVQSNPKFDTFGFRAKPCHEKQCWVKPGQAKPSQQRLHNRAKPGRGQTNSSKFYLYQMSFMLHPFHFLLSTCRVTSIISSIPVDFAQYSHGYWYTLIHSYTLENIYMRIESIALIRRKQSEMITVEQKLNWTERQIYYIEIHNKIHLKYQNRRRRKAGRWQWRRQQCHRFDCMCVCVRVKLCVIVYYASWYVMYLTGYIDANGNRNDVIRGGF